MSTDSEFVVNQTPRTLRSVVDLWIPDNAVPTDVTGVYDRKRRRRGKNIHKRKEQPEHIKKWRFHWDQNVHEMTCVECDRRDSEAGLVLLHSYRKEKRMWSMETTMRLLGRLVLDNDLTSSSGEGDCISPCTPPEDNSMEEGACPQDDQPQPLERIEARDQKSSRKGINFIKRESYAQKVKYRPSDWTTKAKSMAGHSGPQRKPHIACKRAQKHKMKSALKPSKGLRSPHTSEEEHMQVKKNNGNNGNHG